MAAQILVVDDEEDIREICKRAIEMEGYEVDTIEDGEKALPLIQENEYDIILLDIRMPGIDGIKVLEETKKLRPATDVIIITGYPATDTAIEALRYGAYDYIVKPFTVDEVLVSLRGCFEKRALSKEVTALKRITALYEVSKAISSTIELEKLLELILTLAYNTIKSDYASLLLLYEDKEEFELIKEKGDEKFIEELKDTGVTEKIKLLALKNNENLLLTDGVEKVLDINFDKKINSLLTIPLKVREEKIGALILIVKQEKNFTEEDKEALAIFAAQSATIITDARLHNKLNEKIIELQRAYEELKLTQDKLIQSEKLSAVGQLAAGIAHEINNPLNILLGYIQILQRKGSNTEELSKYISIMEQEVNRAAHIVKALLNFARETKPKFATLNINDVINDTLTITQGELEKNNIEIKKILDKNMPQIVGDKGQLQQVFINLILNAQQAMPNGGKLTIKSYKENENTVIEFIDTGIGIKEEHINKIFDPFFTTKDVGKGIGLGLSLAYGIIQRHNGNIEVKSKEKEGSQFKVILPIKQSI